VGIFLEGASPYGVLDMSGNVWEWTRSAYAEYPYKPEDGREDLQKHASRALRSGSFLNSARYARCSFRDDSRPDERDRYSGFRVAVSGKAS
jgi:formylglycine-generating enzyme required for sulfatase activity